MKAAIVLLANYEVQNFVRRIVFELSQQHPIGFFASVLPVHVSLKQPFAFEDMAGLEGYFDALAVGLAPFYIDLDEIYHAEWPGYGLLGVSVRESATLRGLHDRLNSELSRLFRDTSALFDGSSYRFHMTIELGPVSEADPYRAYYEQRQDKKVALRFLAKEIAMFYYTGEDLGSFMCYKTLPLTGEVRN